MQGVFTRISVILGEPLQFALQAGLMMTVHCQLLPYLHLQSDWRKNPVHPGRWTHLTCKLQLATTKTIASEPKCKLTKLAQQFAQIAHTAPLQKTIRHICMARACSAERIMPKYEFGHLICDQLPNRGPGNNHDGMNYTKKSTT